MTDINLLEALEQRRFQPGVVKFSKSSFQDQHIVDVINAVSSAIGKTREQIVEFLQSSVNKLNDVAKIAPVLYQTIITNGVENELFSLFMKVDVASNAPRFSERVFMKLQRTIAGEHDEFWPLRSFVDKRPLDPKWDYVNVPLDGSSQGVTTAAATPNGTFIFNIPFMQKLMDYSNIKQVKPKGRKYVSNGGDIPDEYGYIEFLILHELMHYSNDDFYYQKIIPNSNPKIINWVGDFRSNYLLVKSGYEQLPMGLFNDAINYDRQKSYIEMYRIVEDEFNKLNQDQKDRMSKELDKQSDDHKPGQSEGAKSDAADGKMGPGQIDEKGKQTERQMEDQKDKTAGEVSQDAKDKQGQGQNGPGGPAPKGQDGAGQAVDYSKIKPAFSWQALVKRFLQTAKPRMEETYMKPSRRSVSQMEVARQLGAGAIKQGEKLGDTTDSKLAFCFDSSGSMWSIMGKVFANAVALLQTPQFKRSTTLVFRFSGNYKIFKAIFAQNKASLVSSAKQKVTQWPLNNAAVFGHSESGSTSFNAELAGKILEALKDKWNIIFFLDDDITAGDNFKNLMNVIKASPGQVFIVFDSRDTYVKFRKQSGVSTPNITHF